MFLATAQRREKLAENLLKLKEANSRKKKLAAAIDKWFEVKEEGEASKEAAKELLAVLPKNDELADAVLADKDLLVKKSQWIFGGDGWAYDIGYGGVDHVLAQNQDVNILVLDTEVYYRVRVQRCGGHLSHHSLLAHGRSGR